MVAFTDRGSNIRIISAREASRRERKRREYRKVSTGTTAKTSCRGFELTQKVLNKQRNGYFLLDLLGFKRDTYTNGWAFSGLILIKDGVVIYKLTGGQPSIVGNESTQNPLGPLQMITSKMYGVTF